VKICLPDKIADGGLYKSKVCEKSENELMEERDGKTSSPLETPSLLPTSIFTILLLCT